MTDAETHEVTVGDVPAYNEVVAADVVDTEVVPTAHGQRPRVAVTVKRETTETLPMALHDEAVHLHWLRQRRAGRESRVPGWVRHLLVTGLSVGIAGFVGLNVMNEMTAAMAEGYTVEPAPPQFSWFGAAVLLALAFVIIYSIRVMPRMGPRGGAGR